MPQDIPKTEASASAPPSSSEPRPAPNVPVPSVAATWQSALSAWLHAHKTYPAAARSRGEQGSAAVRFTVTRDGHVTAVALARGSGFTILDEAVHAMLAGARVPPFPSDMPQDQITVTVDISFRLKQ